MEQDIPDGTKEHPLLVFQTGYSCHHATISPKPEPSQFCRIVGYLDVGSLSLRQAMASGRKIKK